MDGQRDKEIEKQRGKRRQAEIDRDREIDKIDIDSSPATKQQKEIAAHSMQNDRLRPPNAANSMQNDRLLQLACKLTG